MAKAVGQSGKMLAATVGKTAAKELAEDFVIGQVSMGTGSLVQSVTGNADLGTLAGVTAGITAGKGSGKALHSVDNAASGIKSIDSVTQSGAGGVNESGKYSPKGLIGHDFEDYLTKNIGGNGSFSVEGRDFDGGIDNRWWEAKSGNYWNLIENNARELEKFKSGMGHRLKIANDNSATYELFSNTPIPDSIKSWLEKKGIKYTELLD